MKVIILTLVTFGLLLVAILPSRKITELEELKKQLIIKKSLALSCSPDWTNFKLTDEEVLSMIPLPGTGTHTWEISSKHDSANFYFNQGMNLYYGFHIIESIPSLKKAVGFDPDCAMLHWAEALAYGPNINDLGYAASPEALEATKKAMGFLQTAGEREKMLIIAMNQRYSPDSTVKREWLNKKYAEAMQKAYIKYQDDPEIGALYADALMLLHPWDLWFHSGQPKPWTNEIIRVLEKVLKIAPNHPGANHYYIHAVEASPFPGKANASADRLGKLTPGLSHMVHMPSHIYIRTGNYQKGAAVNKQAVIQYKRYLALYPEVANNAPLYDLHNRHMQAVCSMNGNNYKQALMDAIECRNSIDTSFLSLEAPLGPFIQFVYMMPEFTQIHFGHWQQILKQPIITRTDYSALLQQFARGMAYINTGDITKAKIALTALENLIQQPALAIPFGPFNAPKAAAAIAQEILTASILEKEGYPDQAQMHFNTAVTNEDALVYNEPKDWLLPARQFQGYALLRMKHFHAAEKIFLEDLRQNPDNVKALKGLKMARQIKNF